MVVVEVGAASEEQSSERRKGKQSAGKERDGRADRYFGLRSFTFHLTERKRGRNGRDKDFFESLASSLPGNIRQRMS
jgi:hypothetical protein